MTLGVLGVGYIGVGVAIAAVVSIARRPGLADALLLVGLWPLYGPFLLLGRSPDSRETELLEALARAAASPLAGVLPDAESARVLARRLREAGTRLAELDEVLARPDFDPVAAEARARELAARGAMAAAGTAQLRVRTLAQLRTLRGRYRSDLDEVGELVSQLVTQCELVRLDPGMAQAGSELVRELVARVEGLGDLFAYQEALHRGDIEVDVGEYQPDELRSP
jgi:DNA-binding transcriptional MerR regulator